ncbi:dynactin subunit 5 [Aspergillus undulatus]|uniref:dynactin subunit 5 n=1 Tax=Aspergillus undulatus TaxID=1810928 RepID=UPI003CCD44D9
MPPKAAKGEYIETDTGNKISRRSQIHGTQHIMLGGKSIIMADAVVRGDLFRPSSTPKPDPNDPNAKQPQNTIAISIGRYTFISRSAILRPPSRLSRGVHSYTTLHIGHHVFVGERTIVEAAKVEDYVTIGKDAVVGNMAILKERCQVLDGAVVPQGMVVPSHCVVGGQPARILGDVSIAYGVEGLEGGLSRERYRSIR